MAEKKYAKYVIPAPIKIVDHDGNTWNSLHAHKGELDTDCSMGFHYITETFEEGPPHAHKGHQIFCFLGSNLEDITDFDAEIEIGLGEEQEIQTITSPSMVSIPPGMLHCPLRFKRLGKPVLYPRSHLQARLRKGRRRQGRDRRGHQRLYQADINAASIYNNTINRTYRSR